MRVRLDEMLVRRGLFGSRSRARDAILRGTVLVDGAVARKAGLAVSGDCAVSVDDPARTYVSRAALKLAAGLDAFGFDPAGATCLDIGASTGGFTQVLLDRGAAHVFAVDVGRGQMAEAVKADKRVTCLEGLNARDLAARHLRGSAPGFVVSDVSFVSLKLALPPALELAAARARAVLLVKPQFEAGREAIGKGGLLRDPASAEAIGHDLQEWLGTQPGWHALKLVPSPIEGGDGNREFLLGGTKR